MALLLEEGSYGFSTTHDSASGLLASSRHEVGPAQKSSSVESATVERRNKNDDDPASTGKTHLLLGEGAYAYSTAGNETSFLLAPVLHRMERDDKLSLAHSVEPIVAEAKSEETASGNSGNSDGVTKDAYLPLSFLRSDTAEDVTDDCIKEHNKMRVGNLKHPLMPVGRDSDAIAQAMKYMRQIVQQNCPFKHSGAPGFGENLYATSGKVAYCAGAVHAWYNEIEHFK